MSKPATAATWRRRAEQAPLAAVWAAGAALTAVGMYSVAVACGIPGELAWLYPLIFDGLALVAYRATNHTQDGARRYAAFVVVLCTGLSALAQAAHLAAGKGLTAGATGNLKAGVGAAPAIAVALAAHLHWLTTRKPAVSGTPESAPRYQGSGSLVADTAPGAVTHRGATDPGADGPNTAPGSAPHTPGAVTGPAAPGPTAPSRVAQPTGREVAPEGAAGGPSGPGHLTVVGPDTSGKPRVSAAGQGGRPLVSVRADSAPDTRPDTTPGHPSDTTRPDTRTPGPDTPPRAPGHPGSGQADHVSELLLSGHSVRAVAAATGHPRSTVQDRRTALVAAGQLPPAKGSQ